MPGICSYPAYPALRLRCVKCAVALRVLLRYFATLHVHVPVQTVQCKCKTLELHDRRSCKNVSTPNLDRCDTGQDSARGPRATGAPRPCAPVSTAMVEESGNVRHKDVQGAERFRFSSSGHATPPKPPKPEPHRKLELCLAFEIACVPPYHDVMGPTYPHVLSPQECMIWIRRR